MRCLSLFHASKHVPRLCGGTFFTELNTNSEKKLQHTRKFSTDSNPDDVKKSQPRHKFKINYDATFESWMKQKLISEEVFVKYYEIEKNKRKGKKENSNEDERKKKYLFTTSVGLLASLTVVLATAILGFVKDDRNVLLTKGTETLISSTHNLINVLFEDTLSEPRSLLELTLNRDAIPDEIEELEVLCKKILLNLVHVKAIYNQINYTMVASGPLDSISNYLNPNTKYAQHILERLEFQISILNLCFRTAGAVLAFRKRDSNYHSLISQALDEYNRFILKEEQLQTVKTTQFFDTDIEFALNDVIANIHNISGVFYDLKKDWDSALKCYESAEKFYNNNPAVLNNIGMVYIKMSKLEKDRSIDKSSKYIQKALDYHQKASRCQPNSKSDFAVFHGLGYTLYQLGGDTNYRSALYWFDRALELKPRFVPGLVTRAIISTKLGNFGQAVEDLTMVISISDVVIETYYRRAEAFYQLGKYQEALDDLNRSSANRKIYPNAIVGYTDEEYQSLYDDVQIKIKNSSYFEWMYSFFSHSTKQTDAPFVGGRDVNMKIHGV